MGKPEQFKNPMSDGPIVDGVIFIKSLWENYKAELEFLTKEDAQIISKIVLNRSTRKLHHEKLLTNKEIFQIMNKNSGSD